MKPTINLDKVFEQGDLWSPVEASVHVDSIGKQMLKEEETGEADILFKYKGEITTPPLALLDDVITITETGIKTHLMNSNMNIQAARPSVWAQKVKVHEYFKIQKTQHRNTIRSGLLENFK